MFRSSGSRRVCFSLGCVAFTLLACSLALAAGSPEGADRSADLLDLLYRFLNFALLVIILFLVLKKVRIKDFFRARREEIERKLEDLRRGKEEAEKKFAEIEKKLSDFEKNKGNIIAQFRAEGLAEKERILTEAEERARQIMEHAGLAIQQEMKETKERLQREVVALAAQKAQEIIVREITDKDQDRLVDEFIDKVGKDH